MKKGMSVLVMLILILGVLSVDSYGDSKKKKKKKTMRKKAVAAAVVSNQGRGQQGKVRATSQNVFEQCMSKKRIACYSIRTRDAKERQAQCLREAESACKTGSK